jgi:hypothetical protein
MSKEQDDILKSIGIELEEDELLPNEQLPDDENDDDVQGDENPDTDTGTTEPVVEKKVEQKPAKTAPTQEADITDGFNPAGKYAADKNGNLIDKAGKIIAKSGAERKLFQTMRDAVINEQRSNIKLAKRLDELARLTNNLYQKYQELGAAKTYASTVGLTEEENRTAVDMAALSKRDPLGAAKMHLTKLHLAGVDISSLGAPGAIDPKTIAAEVTKQVQAGIAAQQKPVTSPEDDRRAAVTAEATEFLDENPEAVPYVKLIGEAKAKYPKMGLPEIWTRIKLAALGAGKAAW